jgi:hypothetical protein
VPEAAAGVYMPQYKPQYVLKMPEEKRTMYI